MIALITSAAKAANCSLFYSFIININLLNEISLCYYLIYNYYITEIIFLHAWKSGYLGQVSVYWLCLAQQDL